MEILELNLKHFGKFLEHKVSLQPGINIIYGDNETGKTTIHAFIRAMFFGLERGRGKREEYQIRQPWDNPAYFAGTMRLRYQDEIYRIERNFYKNDRSLRVICETEGRELAEGQQELEALLDGMNEAVFTNTVFIPQIGSETDEALAEELRRYLVNFRDTKDGDLDIRRALEKLKAQRRELENKKRGEQERLDEEIARKEIEGGYIRQDLEQIGTKKYEKPEDRTEDRLGEKPDDEMVETRETFQAEDEGMDTISFLPLLNILLFGCGVLAVLCGIFAGETVGRIVFFLLGALFLILFGLTMHRLVTSGGLPKLYHGAAGEGVERQAAERQQDNQQQMLRERSSLEVRMEEGKRLWKQEEDDHLRRKKRTQLKNLDQEMQGLFREREQLVSYDRDMEAIDLAMLRIRELSERIYREAGTDFSGYASEILEEITDGRYTQIALDEKMEVRINTPEKLLTLSQVSHGTMNQIYFALRMAAGRLLTGGDRVPVILDEAFAMYDEERLEAALRWLDGSGRQVILFTCQKREKEILDRIRGGA